MTAANRWEHKSEKEKLIWRLAHTASALTDAIRKASEMDDEEFATEYLRQQAAAGRELLK